MSYGREVNYEMFDELADNLYCKVDTAYSGRGMYGRTCPALISDRDGPTTVEIGAQLVVVFGTDEGLDLAKDACTDSMGLGTVIYFPHSSLEALDGELNDDRTECVSCGAGEREAVERPFDARGWCKNCVYEEGL